MIVTPRRSLRGLLALLALGALDPSAVRGEQLVLPVPLESVLAPLREACPGCIEAGFLPCGTPDVQYGRRFAATALQGDPPRAYLLARAPERKAVFAAATGTPIEAAPDAMARAFADLRLVVLDDAWRRVRVLPPSGEPRVELDTRQHACFRERPNDLGCCLGDGPQDRGCLPKADPPSVHLRFDDADTGETLALRYPMSREIQLRRRTPGRELLYWCHSFAHAPLRGSEP
jgi:hypothetical protein